jgi:dTDP-4-amino-4,6-dideoxygalactose transaminase
MITTPHEEVAASAKTHSLHGMSRDAWRRFSDEGFRHYAVEALGFKFNMTDMQAAIGIHQLERLERSWDRRQYVWNTYMETLADLPVVLPANPEVGTRHGLHLFTVLVDEQSAGISRDAFLDAMTAEGIGVGVHYLSLPEHPYYRDVLGWAPEMTPAASLIGQQTVSLPISAKLTDGDIADVVEAVRRVLRCGPLRR